MAPQLTISDLAERTGVAPDELRRWQQLGLLDGGECFETDDAERATLIRFAVARGFSAEALAELAATHGDMIAQFVVSIRPYAGERTYTMDEAAAAAGVEREVFDRVLAAAGLTDQRMASANDLETLASLSAALAGGRPSCCQRSGTRRLRHRGIQGSRRRNRGPLRCSRFPRTEGRRRFLATTSVGVSGLPGGVLAIGPRGHYLTLQHDWQRRYLLTIG